MSPPVGWIPAALLAIVLLAAGPVGAAEFVDYYKAGIVAVDAGQWEKAEELMARAIEIQPDEKPRIKKALFFRRYLPHYYLGRALYESGDCAGALAAWRESVSQGVVTKFPEYELLRQDRDRCDQLRSEIEYSLSQAKGLISVAGSAATKARLRLTDLQASGGGGTESLSRRLDAAESQLRSAEGLLARSGANLESIQRAAASAAEAREGFESIDRESEQWLRSIAVEQVRIRADLNQLVIDGKTALTDSEYLHPYPPGIARQRSQVERLVRQAEGLSPSSPDAEIVELTVELEQAVAELRRSAAEPPAELTHAAEAFLNGQYAQVLEILAEASGDTHRVSAQAHLLQSAALFALYHTRGGGEPALLDQARDEARACQRLEVGTPRPSPNIFSPRFVEFFEDQRKHGSLQDG